MTNNWAGTQTEFDVELTSKVKKKLLALPAGTPFPSYMEVAMSSGGVVRLSGLQLRRMVEAWTTPPLPAYFVKTIAKICCR